jgi:hypothetical protein
MSTIYATSHTGPDGVLKLELPVGIPDADVDVTIVVQPSKCSKSREEFLRFVDATAGKWQGEPLVRPDQGVFEHRNDWG